MGYQVAFLKVPAQELCQGFERFLGVGAGMVRQGRRHDIGVMAKKRNGGKGYPENHIEGKKELFLQEEGEAQGKKKQVESGKGKKLAGDEYRQEKRKEKSKGIGKKEEYKREIPLLPGFVFESENYQG